MQTAVEASEGDAAIKEEAIELIHGSDTVFRDLGFPDADVRLATALLAAEIIKFKDREGLTVQAAKARTGIAVADFSRIRRPDLKGFTVDRLMTLLDRLGPQVRVKFKALAMDAVAA